VLWHRKWLFRCVIAQKQVVKLCYGIETDYENVLWCRKWLFRCVMAQEMVVQVLWHRKWLFRCAMAQEMDVQICYGTETGYADVLLHRKRSHDDNYQLLGSITITTSCSAHSYCQFLKESPVILRVVTVLYTFKTTIVLRCNFNYQPR